MYIQFILVWKTPKEWNNNNNNNNEITCCLPGHHFHIALKLVRKIVLKNLKHLWKKQKLKRKKCCSMLKKYLGSTYMNRTKRKS